MDYGGSNVKYNESNYVLNNSVNLILKYLYQLQETDGVAFERSAYLILVNRIRPSFCELLLSRWIDEFIATVWM